MHNSVDVKNNILIVLMIIALSYVFTINQKSYDTQMIFIFLSLTILIIYKYLNQHDCDVSNIELAEGFTEEFNKINNFIRNVDRIQNKQAIEHPDLNALKQEAQEMNDTLSSIKAKLISLENNFSK